MNSGRRKYTSNLHVFDECTTEHWGEANSRNLEAFQHEHDQFAYGAEDDFVTSSRDPLDLVGLGNPVKKFKGKYSSFFSLNYISLSTVLIQFLRINFNSNVKALILDQLL